MPPMEELKGFMHTGHRQTTSPLSSFVACAAAPLVLVGSKSAVAAALTAIPVSSAADAVDTVETTDEA